LERADPTVEVYAYGGTTPIWTLDFPGYPELNCSVDPKNGNLALGVLAGSCGDGVAVFTKAQGIPATCTPSGQDGLPGCGYDKTAGSLTAASVQWDGTGLAVGAGAGPTLAHPDIAAHLDGYTDRRRAINAVSR
jgi:hypothetical protein